MGIRRGRPPKVEGAKRSAIAVRTTEETKVWLSRAAEANGRSLTQEIEQQLEFAHRIEDEFGGREGLALHRRIAWAIKQAEQRLGSRWTDTQTAFWAALGAIEGALEELEPTFTGEADEMLNRLHLAKEQAQRGYDASYEKLKARFPILRTPHALAAWDPNYSLEPRTVADMRYDQIMTEEELCEAVAGMQPTDEALVREHQENCRTLRVAEIAWTSELRTLARKQVEARQLAKDAARRECRMIAENLRVTRI